MEGLKGSWSFSVHDITGRMIKSTENITSNVYQLDGSDLDRGIYILEIRADGEKIAAGKLLVQ